MTSPFTRGIAGLRNGRGGQSALVFLTTLAALLSLIFATVRVIHLGSEKAAATDAVDAICLSAATWEARGLNVIAALNDGILQCLGAIRWTCAVWAALALCAPFGGWAAFATYSKHAPRIIRNYWNSARRLAQWAEEVRKATPYFVLAETTDLAKKYGIAGSLFPFNPAGKHDGAATLELHVRPGPPLYLADALGPLSKVRSQSHKKKWVQKIIRTVIGIVDSAAAALLRDAGGPIHLLVPEEDLPRRQRVRFAGQTTAAPLPAPMTQWTGTVHLAATAAAEVYGGGATNMTWKSRLTEKGPGR